MTSERSLPRVDLSGIRALADAVTRSRAWVEHQEASIRLAQQAIRRMEPTIVRALEDATARSRAWTDQWAHSAKLAERALQGVQPAVRRATATLPRPAIPRITLPRTQIEHLAVVMNQWERSALITERFLRAAAPTVQRAQEAITRLAIPPIRIPRWDRITEQFQRLQQRWIDSLPENWRDLSMEELSVVARLMTDTGWGLAWVPRGDVLRELIAATEPEAAERCLAARRDEILADLRACLGEVTSDELADPRIALDQAVTSLEAGAPFPAQTMVATVLTSIIHRQIGTPRLSKVRREWIRLTPDEAPFFAFRRNMLRRAVAESLENFNVDRGDPIPSRFNRHATAHHLDLAQFREENALGGLLLAVAFLRELQAAFDERTAAAA